MSGTLAISPTMPTLTVSVNHNVEVAAILCHPWGLYPFLDAPSKPAMVRNSCLQAVIPVGREGNKNGQTLCGSEGCASYQTCRSLGRMRPCSVGRRTFR